MPLNLPDGDTCFIDANIFYYHFVETPPFSDACTDLLERVAAGQITAFASTHVLAEAMHKIMLAEAAARFRLQRTSLVNWLQSNRPRINELSEFREVVGELAALPIINLPIQLADFPLAADIATDMSLLTNDAISVALMRRNGLVHLVTNDNDFDRIHGLTVWKPR
ncbi:MAG TPA: type II toxin-antitoxin system VapC family toxin [Phycisphaerae bacterium]|nr:type II toxin-antitoxin system VapC family toxin [Phycisphaerae bacterium]